MKLAMIDVDFNKVLKNIPLIHTNSSPRDKKLWIQRLKEEYHALIKYVEIGKANDTDWFRLESNSDGTRWFGTCWFYYDNRKYEFKLEFEIPVTYPLTAVEIAIPELDGKTAKIFRGGKVCLKNHFNPLWIKSKGKFGIAHIMALGLLPWLAVEIPDMAKKGVIKAK